jgi:hypothetical protein
MTGFNDGRPSLTSPVRFGTLLQSVRIRTLVICVVCAEYVSCVIKITLIVKLAGNKETFLISKLCYLTCVIYLECKVAIATKKCTS